MEKGNIFSHLIDSAYILSTQNDYLKLKSAFSASRYMLFINLLLSFVNDNVFT